jgi:hypothetical protein
MILNRWLLVFVFLSFALPSMAQPMLYLKKYGTAKTQKIVLGNSVKIKTQSGETAKGEVLSITPSGLQVGPLEATFDELAYIRTYDGFTKGAGRSLVYGSVFFGGIFLVNGVITKSATLFTKGELIFSASFLVAGVILELLAQRTYRLDKQWKVEVIMIPEV